MTNLGEDNHVTGDLLTLQLWMLMGAVGTSFQYQFSCREPATTCKWDHFTTLGLCSDVRNITDETQVECTGDQALGVNCTYDFPGRDQDEPIVTMVYSRGNQTTSPISARFNISSRSLFNETSGIPYTAFTAVKSTWHPPQPQLPPKAEVFHGIWYWCAQTFRNLTILNNIPQGDGRPDETLKLWSKKPVDVQLGRESPEDLSLDTQNWQFFDPSSSTVYNVSPGAVLGILYQLTVFFTRAGGDEVRMSHLVAPLDLPSFLYSVDLQVAAAGVATSLTNQIRTKDNGDNMNATMAVGTATYNQVYIRIQWAWALLPLLEVVLVVMLLGLTIWATRDDPQLKESMLPFLAIGLDDTIRTNLVQDGFRSAQDMEERARNIKVRFVEGNGVAGLVAI